MSSSSPLISSYLRSRKRVQVGDAAEPLKSSLADENNRRKIMRQTSIAHSLAASAASNLPPSPPDYPSSLLSDYSSGLLSLDSPVLPPSLHESLILFRTLDSCFNFRCSRDQTNLQRFSILRPSVESSCQLTFTVEKLLQLLYVYPEAFSLTEIRVTNAFLRTITDYRLERLEAKSTEETIEADRGNLFSLSVQELADRRVTFQLRLQYLLTQFPGFDRIPELALSRSADQTPSNPVTLLSMLTRREPEPAQSQPGTVEIEVAKVNLETPRAAVKGLKPEFLARMRAKQAEQRAKQSQEGDPAKKQLLRHLGRLPSLLSKTSHLFDSHRKSILPYSRLLDGMMKHSDFANREQLEKEFDMLFERASTLFTKKSLESGVFIERKLNHAALFSAIYPRLVEEAKQADAEFYSQLSKSSQRVKSLLPVLSAAEDAPVATGKAIGNGSGMEIPVAKIFQ